MRCAGTQSPRLAIALLCVGAGCGSDPDASTDGGVALPDSGSLATDGGPVDLGEGPEECTADEAQLCDTRWNLGREACVSQEEACMLTATTIGRIQTCLSQRGTCDLNASRTAESCLLACGSALEAARVACLRECIVPLRGCRVGAFSARSSCADSTEQCDASFATAAQACVDANEACEAQCI